MSFIDVSGNLNIDTTTIAQFSSALAVGFGGMFRFDIYKKISEAADDASTIDDSTISSLLTKNNYRVLYLNFLANCKSFPGYFIPLQNQRIKWALGMGRALRKHETDLIHTNKPSLSNHFLLKTL
jgi:cellulose synthase/poly-beta-1,6-N-acetylglucosamine synthase-like glycosyltransferase